MSTTMVVALEMTRFIFQCVTAVVSFLIVVVPILIGRTIAKGKQRKAKEKGLLDRIAKLEQELEKAQAQLRWAEIAKTTPDMGICGARGNDGQDTP